MNRLLPSGRRLPGDKNDHMPAGQWRAAMRVARDDLPNLKTVALENRTRAVDRVRLAQRLNDRVEKLLTDPFDESEGSRNRKDELRDLQAQPLAARHVGVDEREIVARAR